MKTDNELIAEFMGIKRINSHTVIEGRSYSLLTRNYPSQLKYHNNWTWLMPVVEKIQKLFDEAFPPNEEFVRLIMLHEEPIEKEYMDVVGLPIGTPIQEVHQAVVTFIKWYKENKEQ